jgi:hypothetical protein
MTRTPHWAALVELYQMVYLAVVLSAGVLTAWITRRNQVPQTSHEEATYLLSQYRQKCGRLEEDEIPSNHVLPVKLERVMRRRAERGGKP